MAERVLFLKEVCERIGIKPNTVWNYRATGKSNRLPPFSDIDGRLCVPESVLDSWIVNRYTVNHHGGV